MIGGECSHNELACVKQSYCEWPWSDTADEINYELNSKDGTKQPFIHSGCDGLANSYYICYKTQLLSCLAALGKNSRWNFLDLDRDADQRQNRMVLASENLLSTSCVIIRIRRSALSCSGKNSIQTFLYPHSDPDHHQNLSLVTHPTQPKKFIKISFTTQFFELTYGHRDRKIHKANSITSLVDVTKSTRTIYAKRCN